MKVIKILLSIIFILCLCSSCASKISSMSGAKIINRGPAPMGNDLAGPVPIYSKEKVVKIKVKPNHQQDLKEAIKKRILASEKAWNDEDTKLFLSFFANDARIMFGREQKIFTKKEYTKLFPDAFDIAGKVKYDSLSIKILDAKNAKVKGVISMTSIDGGIVWLVKDIYLIKKNGLWLVKESIYDIYLKGDGDPRDRFRPRSGGESL